jgi:hypothetical protein
VRPIPEPEVPNGLLPGRGPIGRGGIEPGFEAGGVEGVPGAGGVLNVAAAGPLGAFGFSSTGLATSVSTTGCATSNLTSSATSDFAVLVAAFLTAFLAAGAAVSDAGFASGNSARSLRATVASMDDDAPLTNSPNSASLAITILLSTPRSFAISYIRTLDNVSSLFGPEN